MNKKLYVWGTGVVLARILEYRISLDDIEAFLDNDESKREYMGKKVMRPEELTNDFEAIIVASTHTEEIYAQCKRIGFDMRKIIFLYNNVSMTDINQDYDFIADVLGEYYAKVVQNRYHLVRNIAKDEMGITGNERLYETAMYKNDYVRAKTFELIATEIKEHNIEGAVAELGVFRGEFAQCINIMLPDRKMYLFDTFEGFSNIEANREQNNGSCNGAFVEAFKNVNIKNMLSKMEHLENVVVKQGLFPDTAQDLEEQFAFVSLDVDFEESTLRGLEYFYPRLTKGGYIFIHDYNYGYFDCVKKAVADYECQYNVTLCKVPICDAIGTLVVTK